MNEQLVKFIELCLTDGIISDKEREVIFRKATEYNVEHDECEIILDSMIQQKINIQNNTIINKEIININFEELDNLFNEALELVMKHQELSLDFLKTKLKLGTNRATRLLEQLKKSNKIPIGIIENQIFDKKINDSLNKDKEFNQIIFRKKLDSLGLNPSMINQFIEKKYNKLWKANCYLSEPTYQKGNINIGNWRDSNINFYVPSNGILNENNAIAYIKANWKNYKDFIVDKSWNSKGFKFDSYSLVDFDKRKIEIVELVELNILN